jgi:hypothetical protein
VHVIFCSLLGVALLTAVVVPFYKTNDPIWKSNGRVDDNALVRAGGYETLSSEIWPFGPTMLRCVPSGSWVAYSEVGYAGFARQDLSFLDTRGLTDVDIAHNAPAAERTSVGVEEFDWIQPRSTVGSEILARRPVMIIDFSSLLPPPTLFGGAYRLERLYAYLDQPPGQFAVSDVYIYLRIHPNSPESLRTCRFADSSPSPRRPAPRPAPSPPKN